MREIPTICGDQSKKAYFSVFIGIYAAYRLTVEIASGVREPSLPDNTLKISSGLVLLSM
jgi:hypothetical protein